MTLNRKQSNTDKTNEIYSITGRITEIIQHIEKHLLTKLNRNIHDEITLGQIVELVKKDNSLAQDEINNLEIILKKRNNLVHHYYKINNLTKHQNNHAYLNNQVNYMNRFLKQVEKLNSYLSK